MKKMLKKYWIVFVYYIVVAVVLSPYLFQNGYFLSIDWIFWPEIFPVEGQYYPNYLLWIFIQKGFSFFVGDLLTQKLFVIGIFAIAYFSTKNLLSVFISDKLLIFVGTLFFILNPFVYPRLVQGQLYILYAYALLPFVIWLLLRERYLASLIVSGVLLSFSPHFCFILALLYLLYGLFYGSLLRKKNIKIDVCLGLFIVVLLNSYWIFAILDQTNILNFQNDFYYFASHSVYFPNIYLEILSLNGFRWNFSWRNFQLEWGFLWYLSLLILAIFSILGGIALFRQNEKKLLLLFCSLFFISVVLSLWVSEENVFSSFNLFLFERMPLYSGMRDANKWSSLLSIIYMCLVVNWISIFLKKDRFVDFVIYLFSFSLPFVFSTSLLLFRYNILESYEYPKEWYLLKKEYLKDFKFLGKNSILALPWHQSLSLSFLEGKVVMNPVGVFFWKNVLVADNIEFWPIYSQSSRKESKVLEGFFYWDMVFNSGENKRLFLESIKDLWIKRILLLKEGDYKKYERLLEGGGKSISLVFSWNIISYYSVLYNEIK